MGSRQTASVEKVRLLGPKGTENNAVPCSVLVMVVIPEFPHGLDKRAHGRKVFGRIAPFEEALEEPGEGGVNPVVPAAVSCQKSHLGDAIEKGDALFPD